MSNKTLEELKPTLMAIDVADVHEPDIPMAVELQEASDQLQVLDGKNVRSTLKKVGLKAAVMDALAPAVEAARAAQSEWTVCRDRTKSNSLRELEEKAYALRTQLLASCRWNLRNNRVALGVIATIADGDGVEDAVQDLLDIAELMDRNADAFSGDETFDPKARSKESRGLSKELQACVSSERLTKEQADAKALRDRSFTHLHGLLNEIREAGRYAFRDDGDMARRFASAYRRRHRVAAKPTTEPAAPPAES